MPYFPVNLNVKDQPCLVVGGGEVGQRKVLTLLECGARVLLVGRKLTPALSDLVESGRVEFLGREYKPEFMEGVFLVMAATSDVKLNGAISAEARQRGILINVADAPDLCSFIVPATVNRGDLIIAVSTGGRSPALAAGIRSRLEKEFGPEYALFLKLMGLVRTRVQSKGLGPEANKKVFTRLIDSDILSMLAQGDFSSAEKNLLEILGTDYTFVNLGFEPEPEV